MFNNLSMRARFNQLIILVLVLLTGGTGLALYLQGDRSNNEENELHLTTTIFPVADIAANIAGNRAKVNFLLPAGASEHTYEPTIQTKEQLAKADVLFIVGAQLDNWAVGLARDENVEVIDLSKRVELRTGIVHHHEGEEVEAEKASVAEETSDVDESGIDPHYWLSVKNGIKIAAAIRDELSECDPENSNYYETNYNSYVQQLTALDAEAQEKLSELTNKELITFHGAFNYLAADYALEIVATIEPFPGQEPSVRYLAEVGTELREHGLKTIYKEPQLSDEIVTALAGDYDVKVLTLDPLGGTSGRDSYLDLIRYNVNTIYAGNSN